MQYLILILLMWRIWWAPNNTSKWQMGFNSAFKVLTGHPHVCLPYLNLWLKYLAQSAWSFDYHQSVRSLLPSNLAGLQRFMQNCKTKICVPHQLLEVNKCTAVSNKSIFNNLHRRGEVSTGLLLVSLKARHHPEDLRWDGRKNMMWGRGLDWSGSG
jgi:hypothetical protein